MFCSYLLPFSSVDEEDTLAVVAVVGIAVAAVVGFIVVIVVIAAVVAVAVFARWRKKEDSGTYDLKDSGTYDLKDCGTYDLKTDVSMECSMQTSYCVFVCIWHKMLSNNCIIIK